MKHHSSARLFKVLIGSAVVSIAGCSALYETANVRRTVENRLATKCQITDPKDKDRVVGGEVGSWCVVASPRWGYSLSGGAYRPIVPHQSVAAALERFSGIDRLCVPFDAIVDAVQRGLEQGGAGRAYAACPELRSVSFAYYDWKRELSISDESPDVEGERRSGSILFEEGEVETKFSPPAPGSP